MAGAQSIIVRTAPGPPPGILTSIRTTSGRAGRASSSARREAAGRADAFHARVGVQEIGEHVTNRDGVVDQENPHGAHAEAPFSPPSGIQKLTAVPSVPLSMRSQPPASSTRSLIAARPMRPAT